MGSDNNALALKFQAGARKDVAFDMDVEREPPRREAARHFLPVEEEWSPHKGGVRPPLAPGFASWLGGNLCPIPQGFGRQRSAAA